MKLGILSGLLCLLVIFGGAVNVIAQDDDKAGMKADKTGTNPINFTYDFRIYNEFQWLNTPGDGEQNITTLEFRMPFAGGKWQFRVKTRAVNLDVDPSGSASGGINEFGMGDTDIRFLTVPYMDMAKKRAVAVGLEVFLDTASEDVLGSGATSLGPQVFAVFFKPFGGMFDLFSPAYQHKFSIEEDDGRSDVHQGLIDVFVLKLSKDKQRWMLLDPQGILDYENNTEFMLVDVEVGTMLDSYFGTQGHSVYLRPSVGIGHYRPYDGSVEVGYKIIW